MVNHSFPPELDNDSLIIRDGVSAHCVGVAGHLKHKYRVTILSPGKRGNFTHNGIRFVHAGSQSISQYKFEDLEFCFAVLDTCMSHEYDYIIAHSGLIIATSLLRNVIPGHCLGFVHDTFPNVRSVF